MLKGKGAATPCGQACSSRATRGKGAAPSPNTAVVQIYAWRHELPAGWTAPAWAPPCRHSGRCCLCYQLGYQSECPSTAVPGQARRLYPAFWNL